MFCEAHVPKRLIAGAIALGSFTFAMTVLPGTQASTALIAACQFVAPCACAAISYERSRAR